MVIFIHDIYEYIYIYMTTEKLSVIVSTNKNVMGADISNGLISFIYVCPYQH